MASALTTLSGVVTEQGLPVPNVPVQLVGPGSLSPTGFEQIISWTYQLSGYSGTLEECWRKHVSDEVKKLIGLNKFYELAGLYNPTLKYTDPVAIFDIHFNNVDRYIHNGIPGDIKLREKEIYLLPELRMREESRAKNSRYDSEWDRPMIWTYSQGANQYIIYCLYVWPLMGPTDQHETNGKIINVLRDKNFTSEDLLSWQTFLTDFRPKNNIPGSMNVVVFAANSNKAFILPRLKGPGIYTRVDFTDSNGKFQFPALYKGSYTLSTEVNGYSSFSANVNLSDGSGEVTHNINLTPEMPVNVKPLLEPLVNLNPALDSLPDLGAGTVTMEQLASKASHLFTFSKTARTSDRKGPAYIELNEDAAVVPEVNYPGCQGKIAFPLYTGQARGSLAVGYDWGRDRDRTWEIVLNVTQPGEGLVFSHPGIPEAQCFIRELGFDRQSICYVNLVGANPMAQLHGTGAIQDKPMYLAISFDADQGCMSITYKVAGKETISQSLSNPKGDISGGRIMFAGQDSRLGFEIFHFAVYPYVLTEQEIKRRFAILDLDPERISNEEMRKMLEERCKRFRGVKLNWENSAVDLLKVLGLNSSLEARKTLAKKLNVPAEYISANDDYARMNGWLYDEVWRLTAENGGNIPPQLMV